MKQLTALLISSLLLATAVCAGDVKIQVRLATAPDGDAVTSFPSDAPKLYALFKTEGLKGGDKLRGAWIAEDVGDAAPKETKIDEKAFDLEGDTEDGVFSLSQPNKGWPAGKYRLEIYVGDALAQTVKKASRPVRCPVDTAFSAASA